MENFINEYIASNGSNSPATKSTFLTSLKRIERVIQLPFEEWGKNTFNNHNEILNILSEDYSVNTIILTILAIIRFIEHSKTNTNIIENYKDILNELIQERKTKEHSQKQTEQEKENWIPYLELQKLVEDESDEYLTKKKSFSNYRNFLILALFTLQPPTRIGNYLDMKIRNNCKRDIKSLNKKYNYICKTENGYRMVFNKYKTSKYLGKIEYPVENPILIELLNKWFDVYVKNDYLFTNANGKPMTQPNFTQAQQSISKKIIGKSLTTNMFRHIFYTWFLSTNPSIEEKTKIAHLTGQTYTPTRMELYERKDVDDPKKEIII